MKQQKHEFPKGITKKLMHQIYDEGGYSDHVENIYENPTIEVNEYRVTVSINWSEEEPTVDTIWMKEYGFKFCPTWVIRELVYRGLAPEIRKEKPEPRPIDSLTEEEGTTAKRILLDELDEQPHPERVEDVIFWALEHYCKRGKGTMGEMVAYGIKQRILDEEKEEES